MALDIKSEANRINFFELTLEELEVYLSENHLISKYRASQIFDWVYNKRVADISQMSNIARKDRELLSHLIDFSLPAINEPWISSDGTRKYLFDFGNGRCVESVMIKQPSRMTLCVSSQVGCGMGCSFCRTGTMGFHSNLAVSEIIGQVLGVMDDSARFNDMFKNIVFMGMGEPFHNYKNLVKAIKILGCEKGLRIPARKITVSTSGLISMIKRFSEEGDIANLAVSLNATTNEVRSKIMPVNRAFPIEKLLNTLKEYPLKRGRRITIEYVMLRGVNDSHDDLRNLPRLLNGIPCKVNLIPYNGNADLGYVSSSKEKMFEWQDYLLRRGLRVTIRWSKGQDINAACGQLVASHA